MPVFSFKCECGEKFDDIAPQGAVKCICPKCGKEANKEFDCSRQAVVFKGSGWTNPSGHTG